MKLHEIGVEMLVAAIYKQAAKDYANALLTNNKGRIKELRAFFKSGAYNVKIGETIMRQVEEDVKNRNFENAYNKEG